jgi:hypothetical protein
MRHTRLHVWDTSRGQSFLGNVEVWQGWHMADQCTGQDALTNA